MWRDGCWDVCIVIVWYGGRTDCFEMLFVFCVFYSQNVAVSKSRHRLLFHPTGKEKSTEKKILFSRYSEYGGFPWAIRYLLIFLNCLYVCFVLKKFFYFVLTPASVFKSVTKCFWKLCLKSVWCEKVCFEQVPTSIYLLEKEWFLFLFPLDSTILLLINR